MIIRNVLGVALVGEMCVDSSKIVKKRDVFIQK